MGVRDIGALIFSLPESGRSAGPTHTPPETTLALSRPILRRSTPGSVSYSKDLAILS